MGAWLLRVGLDAFPVDLLPHFTASCLSVGTVSAVTVCVRVRSVASVVSDCATLRTAARQAPVSVGFSRQELWSGLPFPPPGDLLGSGTGPTSLRPTCSGSWALHH